MPVAFDKMVDALKTQLRKQHPDWKEDKVSSSAYAIATSNWKKTHGGKLPTEIIRDVDGDIVVAENVKLFLDADIGIIQE